MKKILLTLLLFTGLAVSAQKETETLVLIKTNYGNITVKLYNDTPKHRDNFIKLVKEGWYNGSPFHRVINSFMIQGGQNADGRLDPGYTIEAEFNPKYIHKKGALAAARQADQVNPQKRSSGSQFYIVQGQVFRNEQIDQLMAQRGIKLTPEQRDAYTTIGGSPWLDNEYTIFGEVIDGLNVIDKIAMVKTGRMDDPVEPVTMTMEILD